MSKIINPWFASVVKRYPDGSAILQNTDAQSRRLGKFMGTWANGTPLMGCEDDEIEESVSYFDTAAEVAECLKAVGEGPGEVPVSALVG